MNTIMARQYIQLQNDHSYQFGIVFFLTNNEHLRLKNI